MRRHSRMPHYTSSHLLAVPLIVAVVCLLLVNQHPSPVDDHPCFEDAIAFVSVSLGIITNFLILEARPRAECRPVHLRHARRGARISCRNRDLGAVRAAKDSDGGTDHILVAYSRQAERADPAAAAVPLACVGEPRAPAAPAALHACDRICARPAAHAARRS